MINADYTPGANAVTLALRLSFVERQNLPSNEWRVQACR